MIDKNPYNNSIDWLQPQYPTNEQGSIYTTQEQGPAQPQGQATIKKVVPPKQTRMAKQKALELVSSLKKGIVISSVMSFGVLGLLTTGHTVGATANTTKTTTPITRSSSSSTTTPSKATSTSTPQSSSNTSSSSNASSSSSSSSNSSSSSTSQGGTSFGTSSSQNSVSGTSVS